MVGYDALIRVAYLVWTLGVATEIVMLWAYSIEYFIMGIKGSGSKLIATIPALLFTAYAPDIARFIVKG